MLDCIQCEKPLYFYEAHCFIVPGTSDPVYVYCEQHCPETRTIANGFGRVPQTIYCDMTHHPSLLSVIKETGGCPKAIHNSKCATRHTETLEFPSPELSATTSESGETVFRAEPPPYIPGTARYELPPLTLPPLEGDNAPPSFRAMELLMPELNNTARTGDTSFIELFKIGKRTLKLYKIEGRNPDQAYSLYYEGCNAPLQHNMNFREVLSAISSELELMAKLERTNTKGEKQ